MRLLRYILGFSLLPVLLVAQDPGTQKKGKREPASRPLEGSQDPRQVSPLPTIDLPEFVITGTASINPPDADKSLYDEEGIYRRTAAENSVGARERETIDLGERFRQTQIMSSKLPAGMILASLGNYFTPRLMISSALSDPSYDLAGSATYRRTKGFARYADESEGGIGLHGSHELVTGSVSVPHARLGGDLKYDVRSYKFFGSARPSTERNVSRLSFGAEARADLGTDASAAAGLRFGTFGIKDSGTTTTENSVNVDIRSTVPIFDFPVDVDGEAWLNTVTAVTARKLSIMSLSVGTPRMFLGDASIIVRLKGYRIVGMTGQEGGYLYPNILFRFDMTQTQTAFASYQPGVEFNSLGQSIERNRYLSSGAIIRHTNARLAVAAGVESNWTSWLRTKLWIDYRSMTDYPLYADTAGVGIWSLEYGGKTEITTFHIDGVANIGSNDYFAGSVEARTGRNSVMNRVPYLPGFEASLGWRHRFPFDVAVSPSASVIGAADADFAGVSEIGSRVWTSIKIEYVGIPDLGFLVEITNLIGRKQEVWKGYRAEPFRAAAGVTYHW